MIARPRVVIVRPLGLGDFLTGVPAYRAIARAFPGHRRVLAASRMYAWLAADCGLDDVVETAPLAPLDTSLACAEIAINLHGRGPQSHRVILATSPERFIGFYNEELNVPRDAPQWRDGEHEVLRWCRMLSESGIPADPSDLDLHVTPRGGRWDGAVLLHPGASSEARCWPVASWIALAARLRERGFRIALTGSDAEFRRCRLIARNASIDADDILAGHTSLEELTHVVAAARAVICGDTGIAHLATALRTPSVVLFGPISPAQWGPPRERARHRALWHGRAGDPHARVVDAGLADIGVSEVLAALDDALAMRRTG